MWGVRLLRTVLSAASVGELRTQAWILPVSRKSTYARLSMTFIVDPSSWPQ